jgi:hypothetical protein
MSRSSAAARYGAGGKSRPGGATSGPGARSMADTRLTGMNFAYECGYRIDCALFGCSHLWRIVRGNIAAPRRTRVLGMLLLPSRGLVIGIDLIGFENGVTSPLRRHQRVGRHNRCLVGDLRSGPPRTCRSIRSRSVARFLFAALGHRAVPRVRTQCRSPDGLPRWSEYGGAGLAGRDDRRSHG